MDRNQYLSTLNKYEALNFGNLIGFGSWVETEALPWIWDELGGAITKPKQKHPLSKKPSVAARLTAMTASDAVRNGLILTFYDPKQITPLYFQAQMTMLDAEAMRYCKQIEKFAKMEPAPYVNATALTLHRPLVEMMQVALTLLENAGREVAKVRGYYGAWSKRFEHPVEVFNGAQQVIYGAHSGLAHADRAASMATAVLRTALELRLRHAFCIYHMVSKTKVPALTPIDLSTLFEAIQQFEKDIEFDVDVHDVWKIYKWSNLYLHAGMRDFPWVPGFLLQFLRPLFFGPNHVDGGIKVKKAAWHGVRKVIDDSYIPVRGPKKWKLPKYGEEEAQCIIV